MVAQRWRQLLWQCPPSLRCQHTARHRQHTAATATTALPVLPAEVLSPKTPRYHHAESTLPPSCQAGRHCHPHAVTAATATALLLLPLPLQPPHCHCTATNVVPLLLLFPCCHRCCCPATLLLATAVLQLPPPWPPPRCRRYPCAAIAFPLRCLLPLPSCCRCAVHRHHCWLIVVFYPSARCSQDKKGWLRSRSDKNTRVCRILCW